MKKLLVVICMLVYGLPSMGMTINLHYCCGKLDQVSFTTSHKQGCGMAEETKIDKCCHNEQVKVKLSTDQQPLAKWVQDYRYIVDVCTLHNNPYVYSPVAAINIAFASYPVPIDTSPLYLRHRVLLI